MSNFLLNLCVKKVSCSMPLTNCTLIKEPWSTPNASGLIPGQDTKKFRGWFLEGTLSFVREMSSYFDINNDQWRHYHNQKISIIGFEKRRNFLRIWRRKEKSISFSVNIYFCNKNDKKNYSIKVINLKRTRLKFLISNSQESQV